MDIDADDSTVKKYVAENPTEVAEVLRQLLVEAQKKIDDLEDEVDQQQDELENYRQGLGED